MLQQRAYLQSRIEGMKDRKQQIDWLSSLNIQPKSVANFGCSVGYEIFDLMLVLDAHEAVGIDMNSAAIQQARDSLGSIREDIELVERMLMYYKDAVTADDLEWWHSEVPDFLKRHHFPEFKEADTTQPTDLTADHFGLAYCRKVLYHICGELDEQGTKDIQAAVREMARVVTPGGWVVAVEPTQRSHTDRRPLDFNPFFQNAGLEWRADVYDAVPIPEPEGTYIYRKT
jgi:SAM-dependent methyltransferase